MEITIDKLLPIIDNGVSIRAERRIFFDYGFPHSHFEIPEYINPADGDPWDVLVFGYDQKFKPNQTFQTDQLVGVIFIRGGNHKLIFKIPGLKSFSQPKFQSNLQDYMSSYRVNGLHMTYVEF